MGHKRAAIQGYKEQTFHNIIIMTMHIKKTIEQSAQCSGLLGKAYCPEDGPVRPKHVAPNIECIYVLMTFDEHFSGLNVDWCHINLY
jgi:hypothetical protein